MPRRSVIRPLQVVLPGDPEPDRPTRALPNRRRPVKAKARLDLAELVRDKVVEGVTSGTLEVTTKDGLAAQVILDRRDERAQQRDFMLNLAQLLSGGGLSAPRELVEGEFTELEPENALLAPPELRD